MNDHGEAPREESPKENGCVTVTHDEAAKGINLPTSKIPVEKLVPNDYNPNRMSDDEFAELVAEVRHIGRLPKPVIVRPSGDTYQIVDGEHGWRAAKEVGLEEIPCEVIEVDDFEAMRQTYKRNQHGTHNPLLLGKMFQQMMAERELSQRKLAEEVEISEGSVRNAMEYVKAAEVRNSYTAEIETLSLRQVRAYNQLPPQIANMWLDAGGDLKILYKVKTDQHVEDGEGEGRFEYQSRLFYHSWEKAGLLDFIERPICNQQNFRDMIKQLKAWDEWEGSWLVGPIRKKRDELRQYTRHYFEGVWYVRESCLMDSALEWIVDRKTGEFLLTPDQFADCIQTCKAEQSSADDFVEALKVRVWKKHGRKPESKLPVESKHAMLGLYRELSRWDTDDNPIPPHLRQALTPHYTEEAIKKLAECTTPPEYGCGLLGAITIQNRLDTHKKLEEQLNSASKEDLAEMFVTAMYGDRRDEAVQTFREKLATFNEQELLALNQLATMFEGLSKRREESEEAAAGDAEEETTA